MIGKIWIYITCILLIALIVIPHIGILDAISYTVSTVVALRYAFDRWLWKLKPSLFKRYNITGIWKGRLRSSYANTSKTVTVTINQTYYSTTIRIETDINVSNSKIAVWDYDNNNLLYIYTTDPQIDQKRKNPAQYGAAKLVINKAHPEKICIQYWTDRKTIGVIQLKKQAS